MLQTYLRARNKQRNVIFVKIKPRNYDEISYYVNNISSMMINIKDKSSFKTK